MIIKLLAEHRLGFLGLGGGGGADARPGLRLSRCQIVGNLKRWLNFRNNET